MGARSVDIRALVRFVKDQGPVTVEETRFAFSYRDDKQAADMLNLADVVTGDVTEFSGYWTAVVSDHPAQSE